MSEPHEPGHQSTVADIVNENEIRQADHLNQAAFLEDGYGIKIDDLREIYGDTILDCFHSDAEVIKRWIALCDTLRGTDKAMVALLNPKTRLVPGCYGFGKPERHESAADLTIITNPHEATISFEKSTSGEYSIALLRANGYAARQPDIGKDAFDNFSSAPRPLELPIATSHWELAGSYSRDLFSRIADGDTYIELYKSLTNSTEDILDRKHPSLINDPALWRLLDASTRKHEQNPWELPIQS